MKLVICTGPSDEQYEQLLTILKNRLEDGLGECVYEVRSCARCAFIFLSDFPDIAPAERSCKMSVIVGRELTQ